MIIRMPNQALISSVEVSPNVAFLRLVLVYVAISVKRALGKNSWKISTGSVVSVMAKVGPCGVDPVKSLTSM